MHQDRLMKEMDSEWEITRAATEVPVAVLSKRKAETYGVHARTTRSIMVMIPEDKPVARKPSKPEPKPAPEEEAPMHDDIPDDPEALDAALKSKITGIADLLERKRRDEGEGPVILGRPHLRAEAPAAQRLSG